MGEELDQLARVDFKRLHDGVADGQASTVQSSDRDIDLSRLAVPAQGEQHLDFVEQMLGLLSQLLRRTLSHCHTCRV